MIEITTGTLWINQEKGWSIKPLLAKELFLESDLYLNIQEGNSPRPQSSRHLFVNHIDIDGTSVAMEIRFGRNSYIEKVILRLHLATTISEWSNKVGWENEAIKIKDEQDVFLQQQTNLIIENREAKEIRFDAEWGSISSIIDLTEQPDVRIEIRYRNLQESEKEKYLKICKNNLYGKL